MKIQRGRKREIIGDSVKFKSKYGRYTKQTLAAILTAALAVPGAAVGAEITDVNNNAYTNNYLSDEYVSQRGLENFSKIGVNDEATNITLKAADVPFGDIRWDFVTDEEGFVADSGLTGELVSIDGALRFSGMAKPMIKATGLSLNPSVYKYIHMRIKNNSSCFNPDLYLLKNGYAFIHHNKYTIKDKSNSGDIYTDYVFEILSNTGEGGQVEKGELQTDYDTLRLDFPNCKDGIINIDYIVLSQNEVLHKNDFIKSVSIGNATVGCENTDSAYLEAEVYEDIYKTLDKEDISITFNDGTSVDATDIKIKSVKDRKIVDITAASGKDTQSVRIVCKSVERLKELTVDTCEINGKFIRFGGNLKDDEGKGVSAPVTVLAYKASESVNALTLKFAKVIMPNDDGSFEGVFGIDDEEFTPEMYDLAVVFDAMGVSTPEIRTFKYLNDKYAENNIAALKDSSDAVFEFMCKDENKLVYERLGVWLELYNSQSDDTKNKINQYAGTCKGEMTESNVAELANASFLAVIAKDLSDDKLADLLEKYDKEDCKLEITSKGFSETENKVFGDFAEDGQRRIAAKIKKSYIPKDYKELKNAVREAMLLEETSQVTYMKLKDLLLDNTEILGDSLTELRGLTDDAILDDAMKSVSTTAKNSGFESAEKLTETVKSAIKTAKENADKESTGNKGSGSSHGGSGGSFGLSGKPTNSTPTTDNGDTDEKNGSTDTLFNDMHGFDWASEAVSSLAEKGIVNGVGENKFEPAATVKREEFVKMIVNAFNISADNTEKADEFKDVDKESWAYPYIAAATERGIINGTSDSAFGVGDDIKREDMAVIIYRTLTSLNKIGGDLLKADFADYDEISDYAKAAVDSLSVEGIINGKDENRFSPADSATRAEAAVIIYRCLGR